MPQPNGDATAVILSGGGAYAAYEVGVMRALFSGQSPSTGFKPLHPQVIAGTSSGAFTAALFTSVSSQGFTAAVENVADVWLDQVADQGQGCGNGVFRYRPDPFRRIGPQCANQGQDNPFTRFLSDTALLTEQFIQRGVYFVDTQSDLDQRILELFDLSSIISTEPFANTVRRTISLEQVRSSATKLLIATTNWKSGELRIFQNADMTDDVGHDIIRASAALPGLFDSVDIQGEPYVDGGVVLNTPLKPAIDAGASSLHIVYINPEVVKIPLPRVRNTISDLFRALISNLALSANTDIEVARQVNLGIDLFEHPDILSTRSELKTLITQLSGIARHIESETLAYRPLTVHRYHPQEMYGGLFKWLSFGRDHVLALMQRGYADTLTHDCKTNGCVIPPKGSFPLA
jgi:predicted acylesterase/phospholipase RssA